MAKIKFYGNKVFGADSLVNAPSDANYDFEGSGNEIHGVKDLFHFRDTTEIEFLTQIGLSKDADFELINAVLSYLKTHAQAPDDLKLKAVEESGLTKWLNIGETASSLTKNLIEIVNQYFA